MRPAKTQISLCIRPVWSESSLSTWRKLGSLSTHWAHSEDPDQTGRTPRLIWVFEGRTCHFVCLVIRRFICYEMSRSMTKPAKWRPAKTQICPRIRRHSLLSALRRHGVLGSRAPSEDSDQTGRMPRLISVISFRSAHRSFFYLVRFKNRDGDIFSKSLPTYTR